MAHSEEWEAVSETLKEENDECLQVPWAPNGVCPCCGDLLELHDVDYPISNGGVYQLCNSCGWESETGYDL